MPYKSDAQRRAVWAGRKKLQPAGDTLKLEQNTLIKKLPEKIAMHEFAAALGKLAADTNAIGKGSPSRLGVGKDVSMGNIYGKAPISNYDKEGLPLIGSKGKGSYTRPEMQAKPAIRVPGIAEAK